MTEAEFESQCRAMMRATGLPRRNGIVIAGHCNWCSRQVAPSELTEFSTGQAMCQDCRDWHRRALDVLAGIATPQGCEFCQLTYEQLAALSGSALAARMFLVPADGVYAWACGPCKDAYCAKRADLYRGTAFGRETLKL